MNNNCEMRNKIYDTVLLDYEMPELNGPAACKQMCALFKEYNKIEKVEAMTNKGKRNMYRLPVIVGITGMVLPEDMSYFKKCGADDVIPKPVKLNKLEEIWAKNG